jgi:cytidine deaminase
MNPGELVRAALKARENAYAPYSNYKVGAALLAAAGKVFTGCNVENATYGLTVCAERVALWKAISEGEREFSAVAVVTESEPPASPCGACRQLLWEFCGDIEVILANTRGQREVRRVASLLPDPFDRGQLTVVRSG